MSLMNNSTTKVDSLIRNLQLKEDGSNYQAWRFKIDSVIDAAGLESAFQIKHLDKDSKTVITTDVLNSSAHRKKISNMSKEDFNSRNKFNNPEKKKRKTARLYLTSTISDGLYHLINNKPKDPAVCLASLDEHFAPTDSTSIRQLYQRFNHAKITNHSSFKKFANEVKNLARRLREQGEGVTEKATVTALIDGLVPESNFEMITTVLDGMPNISYKDATELIASHLRKKKRKRQGDDDEESFSKRTKISNGSKPSNESYMRMIDARLRRFDRMFKKPRTYGGRPRKFFSAKRKRRFNFRPRKSFGRRQRPHTSSAKRQVFDSKNAKDAPPMGDPSNANCWWCGKKGHFKSECRSRLREETTSRNNYQMEEDARHNFSDDLKDNQLFLMNMSAPEADDSSIVEIDDPQPAVTVNEEDLFEMTLNNRSTTNLENFLTEHNWLSLEESSWGNGANERSNVINLLKKQRRVWNNMNPQMLNSLSTEYIKSKILTITELHSIKKRRGYLCMTKKMKRAQILNLLKRRPLSYAMMIFQDTVLQENDQLDQEVIMMMHGSSSHSNSKKRTEDFKIMSQSYVTYVIFM